MNDSKVLSIMVLSMLLPGCTISRPDAPEADNYHLKPDHHLSAVAKVAIVELYNDSRYPQISADTTEALFQALQKKQIFSLIMVAQNDPDWRGLELDSDSIYTLAQQSAIRKALQCDAVLVGTLTQYQPYPHMTLAIRLKLLDLRSGQLLWALEQIWDAADKTTETRIQKYFRRQMRSGDDPLREKLVSISAIKFIRFVAYEVGENLTQGSGM